MRALYLSLDLCFLQSMRFTFHNKLGGGGKPHSIASWGKPAGFNGLVICICNAERPQHFGAFHVIRSASNFCPLLALLLYLTI